MRLDTANRSFWRLVAVAFAPYVAVALFCCGVVSVVGYRLASEGRAVLGGWPLAVLVSATVVTIVVGVALAIRSLRRQLAATRAFEARVRRDRIDPAADVLDAAQRLRIRRVDFVDDDRVYSFTYGLTAPRVVVSRGLVRRTDTEQLQAVLAHERYHVRNLDPLKMLVARVLRSALFFLPTLRILHDRYFAGRELAADRAAYRACGREPLAAALYQVAASGVPLTPEPAAAIGGTDVLEVRLAQLEDGHEPTLPAIPVWSAVTTLLGVIAMAAGIAVVAGLAAGTGAMSGDGALGILGALCCAALWVVGALLVWRHLARTRR